MYRKFNERGFKNKKNILRRLLLVSAFCIFLFGVSAGAQAQEEPSDIQLSGVQVSPTRFDWDLEPLDERTGKINLKNYTDKLMRVEVSIEDFFVTDDSTEARFFVPNEKHPLYAYDVINWIDPKAENLEVIEIPAGESRDFFFTTKVPESTPTGGYYGAIFFRTLPDIENTGEEGARIGVSTRVGVLLVMAVTGSEPLKKSGEIQEFKSLSKIYLSSPAQFETNFFNSGNIHYRVAGNIKINKFGKEMVDMQLDSRIVYPQKIRTFKNSWNFSNWNYGYYTASLEVQSEDGLVTDSTQVTFWVIPWKTTASIILLIIIIWIILRLFSQKFEIKRKSDDVSGSETQTEEEQSDRPENNNSQRPTL